MFHRITYLTFEAHYSITWHTVYIHMYGPFHCYGRTFTHHCITSDITLQQDIVKNFTSFKCSRKGQ